MMTGPAAASSARAAHGGGHHRLDDPAQPDPADESLAIPTSPGVRSGLDHLISRPGPLDRFRDGG